MPFSPRWTEEADSKFRALQATATASLLIRQKNRKAKAAKAAKAARAEGLFKQIEKCVRLLLDNPRHPGLNTHEYESIEHPYDKRSKVFEAYVQNQTPGAYRLFWCYGPNKGEITIIAITPHP